MFSVSSKFVLVLRFFNQGKMTISVILREKKARRMEVYGGLKLKTSQIKEGKHERFFSPSLFFDILGSTPVSCVGSSCLLCLVASLGTPASPPHWSQVWGLSVINWQPVQGGPCFWPRGSSNRNNIPTTMNWISNIYLYVIYDIPTYLSKRIVVHSKQISLERNRSENSKTL